jgi:DNA-binding PucR family transcriptional regulator
MARAKAVPEGQGAADIRRKVVALRSRVAMLPANAKVEVDAGTLVSILTAAGPALLADEISPQEAAHILQMSRPSVMRLIDKGVLHTRKILSRNKLSRAEVLAYRFQYDSERRQALENLTSLSDEFDF